MQEGDVQLELIAADEAEQEEVPTEAASEETENMENTEPLAEDLHSEEKSD